MNKRRCRPPHKSKDVLSLRAVATHQHMLAKLVDFSEFAFGGFFDFWRRHLFNFGVVFFFVEFRHLHAPFVELLIVVPVRELVPIPVAVVDVVANCDFFLALLCQPLDEVRWYFFQPELLRGFVALISS